MLNPMLYTQLEKLFGEVRIANEGEEMVTGKGALPNGRTGLVKLESGEQYRVNCPMCGDTRFRLYISHRWGIDKGVIRGSNFVICQNERCDQNLDRTDPHYRRNPKRYLQQKLKPYFSKAEKGGVLLRRPPKTAPIDAEPLPFPKPEWSRQVNKLPVDHYARMFLANRHYDVDEVWEKYGVVFCDQYPVQRGTKRYDWLAGRIFIPTGDGGWQARAIGSAGGQLKYFSCPGWKKSKCVYNIEEAKKCGTTFAVLMEGVTDVWRAGGPSIDIFGKSISQQQVTMIAQNWETVAVALDPDAAEDHKQADASSVRRTIRSLSRMVKNVFMVHLPDGRDPSECDYNTFWNCVEADAIASGCKNVKRASPS